MDNANIDFDATGATPVQSRDALLDYLMASANQFNTHLARSGAPMVPIIILSPLPIDPHSGQPQVMMMSNIDSQAAVMRVFAMVLDSDIQDRSHELEQH